MYSRNTDSEVDMIAQQCTTESLVVLDLTSPTILSQPTVYQSTLSDSEDVTYLHGTCTSTVTKAHYQTQRI